MVETHTIAMIRPCTHALIVLVLVALPALCDCLVCRVLVRMKNSRATKIPHHTSRAESVLWGNHSTLSTVVSASQERVTLPQGDLPNTHTQRQTPPTFNHQFRVFLPFDGTLVALEYQVFSLFGSLLP
jgi:hypothetical protein